MSSSDPSVSRRVVLAKAGLATLGLGLLSGCSFRPLYGQRSKPDGTAAGSTVDDLATIYIKPISDRPGQVFHNFLRDRITPRGLPARPNYFLEVELQESTREVAVRRDETATRANLRLQAYYELLDSRDESVLIRGSSQTITSYNILSSQFATLSAENDARERGLRELADDLRSQIAIYFSRARNTT